MTTPIYKFAIREDLKDVEDQFIPTKAEPHASGWDVKAAQQDRKPIILSPFEYAKIDLGIRAFCPQGYWFELKPRSSTFGKKNLHALYGTIDEGYEGTLLFACQYIPLINPTCISYATGQEGYYGNETKDEIVYASEGQTITIKFGDAIGQIIPVKRQEMGVMKISNEEYDKLCKQRGGKRGAGGFGSTG